MTKKIKNKKTGSKFLDLKNVDRATEAAIYYGFMPIETPKIEKEDRDKAKSLKEGEAILYLGTNDKIKNIAEEKSALLKNYFNSNMAIMPQPVMITYNGFIDEGSNADNRGKQRKIGLEIIGSEKSVSEAIIIKTAIAILEDVCNVVEGIPAYEATKPCEACGRPFPYVQGKARFCCDHCRREGAKAA